MFVSVWENSFLCVTLSILFIGPIEKRDEEHDLFRSCGRTRDGSAQRESGCSHADKR
jgi:hypothetical protein